MDVSLLVPEARPLAREVAAVYLRHTRPWFIGLIAHGSALKGGFIPGCSDLDLQLYLDDAAFTPAGHLPLPVGVAIQRDLACIDPAPFLFVQGYPLPSRTPPGWVGPIPGAYAVIAGRLPVPEATEQELQASARTALSRPELTLPWIPDTLLQHGGWELMRRVRLVCTDVWPALYHVLTIRQQAGIYVWGLPKPAAIALLPPDSGPGRAIRAFHDALLAYYPAAESGADALAAIERGVAFLQAARAWWLEAAGAHGDQDAGTEVE